MKTQWQWPPVLMTCAGAILVLIVVVVNGPPTAGPFAGIAVGLGLCLSSIPFLRRDPAAQDAALSEARATVAADRTALTTERAEMEQWRDEVREELDQQAARLEARERSLAEQFAAHQELYEFPTERSGIVSDDEHTRLSDQDRRVLEMLEQEAEVAYEKIRTDGYTRDCNVDVGLIREDIVDLINRVARVYSPESENPLLETSFEQLARAAGRICLHSLVLLEQLPLDVKQYNINSMYSYVQKAIAGYGAYQKAAPWLSYLSRSAYAGRFLAGANPVTLGAWLIATEVGKRAGAKVVSTIVDRQAIGLLHDLIRVVGFEIANIYGGDFRHRDPNWVYGAELTELVGRFPLSRESLREGLQQVSGLPLRSEYDRIYLYRCLADHRAAGLTLADPAQLTRAEREQIARNLEQFFANFIHGADDDTVAGWQDEFEQRFDMKLQLTNQGTDDNRDRTQESARSIQSFLQCVVGLSAAESAERLKRIGLPAVDSADALNEFQPPDFDPAEPAVDTFLTDLIRATVPFSNADPQIEQLLQETGAYFRRPLEEVRDRIDAHYVSFVTSTFVEAAPTRRVPPEIARSVIRIANGRTPAFAYPDLVCDDGQSPDEISGAWLVAFAGTDAVDLVVLSAGTEPLWTATSPHATRDKGFLIDDCRLTGGKFSREGLAANAALVVQGTIRGGGYSRWFGALLDVCAMSGS